jgi:hypothetical protein
MKILYGVVFLVPLVPHVIHTHVPTSTSAKVCNKILQGFLDQLIQFFFRIRKNGSAENIFRETGKILKGLRGMVVHFACAWGIHFIQQCPQSGNNVQKYTLYVIFTNSMQTKKQVHLVIPAALHKRSRELGINLSIICRRCIMHRVKMIEEGLERDRNIERIT